MRYLQLAALALTVAATATVPVLSQSSADHVQDKVAATVVNPPPVQAEIKPLTDKQRLLAEQADRLLIMATELKSQVDKTNKNILSMTVVKEAAEIEAYAHRLRTETRK